MNKLKYRINSDQSSKLKNVMEKKEISQVKLAEKVGVSQGYISHALNGNRELSFSIAKKIYRSLGNEQSISFINSKEYFVNYEKERELGVKPWIALYNSYVSDLEDIFRKHSKDVRLKILGKLEETIKEYKDE
jgi:transcriptional regulator with XRE-family HTH domain